MVSFKVLLLIRRVGVSLLSKVYFLCAKLKRNIFKQAFVFKNKILFAHFYEKQNVYYL
jgi:hypothetical protein